MQFPISCFDDFYKDPDKVREFFGPDQQYLDLPSIIISTKNKRREYKIYFCVKEYSLCNDFNAKNGANKINE